MQFIIVRIGFIKFNFNIIQVGGGGIPPDEGKEGSEGNLDSP